MTSKIVRVENESFVDAPDNSEFLAQLEAHERFRYTENDKEFMAVKSRPLSKPPIQLLYPAYDRGQGNHGDRRSGYSQSSYNGYQRQHWNRDRGDVEKGYRDRSWEGNNYRPRDGNRERERPREENRDRDRTFEGNRDGARYRPWEDNSAKGRQEERFLEDTSKNEERKEDTKVTERLSFVKGASREGNEGGNETSTGLENTDNVNENKRPRYYNSD